AVAQGTTAAAGVLAEFASEVRTQAAVAPATALDQLLAQIASMQAEAQVTAAYAQLYAVTFAAKATPAAPATDAPTDTPAADASGMAAAMPPTNDPHWQAKADGLKVWDVQTGTGAAVTSSSTVSVYYTGWLAANGTRFDTNTGDGSPLAFQING